MTAITIEFDGREVHGTLADNATARSLLAHLPLMLSFSDYGGQEKIARLPQSLSTDGAAAASDAPARTIGYYVPNQSLVLYYDDVGRFNGIVPIGTYDTAGDAIARPDRARSPRRSRKQADDGRERRADRLDRRTDGLRGLRTRPGPLHRQGPLRRGLGTPRPVKRDRSLITVAALTALGKTDQLQFHLAYAGRTASPTTATAAPLLHLAFQRRLAERDGRTTRRVEEHRRKRPVTAARPPPDRTGAHHDHNRLPAALPDRRAERRVRAVLHRAELQRARRRRRRPGEQHHFEPACRNNWHIHHGETAAATRS